MSKLIENIYNYPLSRSAAKLKLWRYEGLMLTYKCPAACRFCYYNCGPDKSGLMPIEVAIGAWQSLRDLAGEATRIHITGGEPFLYFDHMAEILAKAQELNLPGLDAIETNGFWATDEEIIVARLRRLDSLGRFRLSISWDAFHAEFIDVALIKRLAETATKILGADRVFVRWEKYLQEPVETRGIPQNQRPEAVKSALRDYPCRFTGRASGQLAELVAGTTVETLASSNCRTSFLGAKGVHIDPAGNVFSGLCSGIVVGNVDQMPLEEIWKQFDPPKREFISTLFEKGPAGVLAEAVKAGYPTKPLYADKCHLCNDIRQFFFDIGRYKSIIGPCDCYRP